MSVDLHMIGAQLGLPLTTGSCVNASQVRECPSMVACAALTGVNCLFSVGRPWEPSKGKVNAKASMPFQREIRSLSASLLPELLKLALQGSVVGAGFVLYQIGRHHAGMGRARPPPIQQLHPRLPAVYPLSPSLIFPLSQMGM